MNEEDKILLESIKENLGITIYDELVNKKILRKAKAVKEFLVKSGAPLNVGATEREIECISIGVNDLLLAESGEGKYSELFFMYAIQICRGRE